MTFIAGFLQAQAKPERLFFNGNARRKGAYPIAYVKVQRCAVDIFTVAEPTSFAFRLNLRELDPLLLAVKEEGLKVEASGSAKTIPVFHIAWRGGGVAEVKEGRAYVSTVLFHLPDREQSDRLHRALKHAIVACGGRVTPF
jgi:hypothetical protein